MATSPPQPHLLRDLAIETRHRELRPVYRLSERRAKRRGAPGTEFDFELREGRDNLAQAIIMRLLTPRGELAPLGHPGYGSRLHELVGHGNTSTGRNLARLHILDALQQEPRVEAVEQLRVEPSPGRRDTLDVLLRVSAAGFSDRVEIGPFLLDLAP